MTAKKKKKPGRKPLLTKELTETIATALSNGLTRETSSKYARISYRSFFGWYNRGRIEFDRLENGENPKRSEKIYLHFFNQVETAEADAIVGWQDTINKAARNDPQWAFKMAALRDRGYRNNEVALTLDLTKATDEQLERIANGEDPLGVMAGSGSGASGTAPTPESTIKPG